MKAEENSRLLPDIIKEHAVSTQVKLPVFPGAAFELQQLLTAEDVSIDQISGVISKDQAIATHVLKLANSAYFSNMNRSVRTIKDAIMYLGSNHIFNLVICSCQHVYYRSQNKAVAEYLSVLWQHALCVSIGAKWLVGELGYGKCSDNAFMSGLLHDIGKLAIIKIIESIDSDGKYMDLHGPLVLETIRSMHAEHGYNLMDSWSIPRLYCNISLNHHNHDFDKQDMVLMAVRISNKVCNMIGISNNPEMPIDLMTLPEVQALDIEENVLSDLETVMMDAMQTEYSMLNELNLDNSTPYGIYL